MEWGKLRKAGLGLVLLWLLLATGPEEQHMAVGGEAQVELEEGGPPLVALTFDDGPREETTRPLLEGLALREVPATFFLVGERICGSETLIQDMAAGGHQIGVHTYSHIKLAGVSRTRYDWEIGSTRRELDKILGPGQWWLRPPYGILDQQIKSWADCPLVLWSVDPEDWKYRDADRVVDSIVSAAKDGDIILMHDSYPSSVEAALRVVDILKERGFCFVTVEQLMALRGEPVQRGVCIRALPPKN